MSKTYDNNYTGVLFVNTPRTKDTHPNMRGSIELGGVSYWVSAWTKQCDKYGKYLSLALTPKLSTDKDTEEPADDLPF